MRRASQVGQTSKPEGKGAGRPKGHDEPEGSGEPEGPGKPDELGKAAGQGPAASACRVNERTAGNPGGAGYGRRTAPVNAPGWVRARVRVVGASRRRACQPGRLLSHSHDAPRTVKRNLGRSTDGRSGGAECSITDGRACAPLTIVGIVLRTKPPRKECSVSGFLSRLVVDLRRARPASPDREADRRRPCLRWPFDERRGRPRGGLRPVNRARSACARGPRAPARTGSTLRSFRRCSSGGA